MLLFVFSPEIFRRLGKVVVECKAADVVEESKQVRFAARVGR